MATLYRKVNGVAVPLSGGGGSSIDDTTVSSDTSWSSEKVSSELENLQPEWVGTQAEWDALSDTEKDKYDNKIINITDDFISESNTDSFIKTDNILTYEEISSTTDFDDNSISSAEALKTVDSKFGGIEFGVTEDNKPQWKVSGADTWIPFKSGGVELIHSFGSNFVTYNSSFTKTGDFSKYGYLLITAKYRPENRICRSFVEKNVSGQYIEATPISDTGTGFNAWRTITFTDSTITISGPLWNDYGLLKDIYGVIV